MHDDIHFSFVTSVCDRYDLTVYRDPQLFPFEGLERTWSSGDKTLEIKVSIMTVFMYTDLDFQKSPNLKDVIRIV